MPLTTLKPFIGITNLVKDYGTPASPMLVLRDVSLAIASGERVALLGKSGSGKSTLLNLLGGLDTSTSGQIEVAGRNLNTLTSNERAEYRLSVVGMIFQAFHLIPNRSALENVEMPMILAGVAANRRREQALEMLQRVGMGHRLESRPNKLSGGERQRVAIARALVNRPQLILADEPTGNLDSATGDEVVRLLLDYLERSQATLVLVTHDIDLARRCAQRIIHIHDGQLQ